MVRTGPGALVIGVVGILALSADAQISERYCGPGRFTVEAGPQVNEACRRHDEAYARIPGNAKYVPGLGCDRIQQADRDLVLEMRSILIEGALSNRDRRIARAVGQYFRGKGMMDGAGLQIRQAWRAWRSRGMTGGGNGFHRF